MIENLKETVDLSRILSLIEMAKINPTTNENGHIVVWDPMENGWFSIITGERFHGVTKEFVFKLGEWIGG